MLSALGKERQEYQEFKASFTKIESSKLAWVK